jgi:heme A synthase
VTPTVPVAPTSSAQPARPLDPLRAVWTAIILLTAVLVSVAAGLLSVAGGRPVPLAIITAGGSFGSTIVLLLALAQFLTGNHSR